LQQRAMTGFGGDMRRAATIQNAHFKARERNNGRAPIEMRVLFCSHAARHAWCPAGNRKNNQAAALFLMAPTIAVRTAPATPPPATWPMMLPISGVEALSPDAAADCAGDGISKRTEIDILGGACGDISADGAADDLYDQIDEHSRHSVILPRSGIQFEELCRAPNHRHAVQPRRLSRKGHAALAKDSHENAKDW
jgi:hypothetical protein